MAYEIDGERRGLVAILKLTFNFLLNCRFLLIVFIFVQPGVINECCFVERAGIAWNMDG